jgi:hypothetical protein
MRRAVALLAAVALIGLGLVVVAPPSFAKKSGPACGDTITTDITLHADLVDCPNNGLIIGADDITLNLNGHTIDGDDELIDPCPEDTCDIGIDDPVGHAGVRVVGGTITEFGFGVLLAGADQYTLSGLTATDNIFAGVLAFDTTHLSMAHSTVTRNGLHTDFSGVAAFGVTESVFAHNHIEDNGDIGIFAVEGMARTKIVDNRLGGNPEAGMIVEGSGMTINGNHLAIQQDGIIVAGDYNMVRRNHITGVPGCHPDCGFGISFEGGVGNVIENNHVARAHWGIRVDAFAGPATGTIIRRNTVILAGEDGIIINPADAGPVEDTLVAGNLVTRSGDDGIDVRAPSTTLTGNHLVRNLDHAIEAVAGVTDGGGNRGVASGNPVQCTNIVC